MFSLTYKNFAAGNNASKQIESANDSNFASYTMVDFYVNNYIKQRSRSYCIFSSGVRARRKHPLSGSPMPTLESRDKKQSMINDSTAEVRTIITGMN